jgi:hypothetical protein
LHTLKRARSLFRVTTARYGTTVTSLASLLLKN